MGALRKQRDEAPSGPVKIDPDALYTREHLAALGVGSVMTLWKAERSKDNPLHGMRTGRRIFYRGRDILAWMERARSGAKTLSQASRS